MAESGFKHIAVTAAEEEDVIIHAGITREAASAESVEQAPGAVLVEDDRPVKGVAAQATAAPSEGVAPTAGTRQAAAPERAAGVAAPASSRRAKADKGYRETTLEDLEGQSMSMTQKIVIIAAVLCIIGAVAYYAIFMG